MNRRAAILITVLAVIAALVILDRAIKPTSSGTASTTSTRTAAFRDVEHLLAEEQALIASGPRVIQARNNAQAQWDAIAQGMIHTTTIDLAQVALREAVTDALGRDAIATTLTPVPNAGAPNDSVQLIAINVSFDAPSPDVAYALLDRLAHMPTTRTRLADLRITGPGIKAVEHIIRVRVTVEAYAHIVRSPHG